MPKPTYGSYEFGDCTEQKVPHGTNCTLLCPEGFTVRGPETKTCAGKKNGIWTHKNKNAKCVGKLAKAFPSWNMTEMKFTSQIGKANVERRA